MQIRIDVAGQLDIKQRLKLLELPAAKRRRLLGQVGRKVRTASRTRLRAQRDLQGRAWTPRKARSNRKMLRGLSKHLAVYSSAEKVDVTFNNVVTGRIARQQQDGIAEVMTSEKMRRLHGTPDYQAPATRRQAKALREAGFKKRRNNGKGYINATIKWITQNLTLGQAGVILRMMRNKAGKSSWVIPLPARSFLGATERDINDMVQTIFNQTVNARA